MTVDNNAIVLLIQPVLLQSENTMRRRAIIFLGIAILALVLAVDIVLSPRSGTRSSTVPVIPTIAPPVNGPTHLSEQISKSIEWSVRGGVISLSDEREIKTALRNINLQSRITEGTYVNITSARVRRNWGILYGVKQANDPGKDAAGTVTFLLEKNGSNWRVITEDDSDFCSILNQLPESVVGDDGIAFYPDCTKSP